MATENRRVAAYLPEEIDEQLKAFKVARGFATQEGLAEKQSQADSQALVIILSEFFGVSQNVTHQSNSNLELRIDSINESLSELKSELLAYKTSVDERLKVLEARLPSIHEVSAEVKSELLSELKSELYKTAEIPGQLELIPNLVGHNYVVSEPLNELKDKPDSNDSGLMSEPKNEPLESSTKEDERWMSIRECWEYLGEPGSFQTFRKHAPKALFELYGIQSDPARKGKYNSLWVKPPKSAKGKFKPTL